MRVTPLRDATRLRLRVRNGCQKSDRLWKANGRPHTVTVTLLPSKVAATRTLVDQMGWPCRSTASSGGSRRRSSESST
jgi:hypothetical protein